MNIAFVVLHYKVASITEECIGYLLQQKYDDLEIIVIDNGSANGSYESLRDKYREEKRVYLTSIEYNLGFAKANDLGYQIAKHKYGAKSIAIINNDLMIEDVFFCHKVVDAYKQLEFDILGPDIVNKFNEHQNPLKDCIKSEQQLDKLIKTIKIKSLLIPLLFNVIKKNKKQIINKEFIDKIIYNAPLHGSCLIFGQSFIEKYEYPFYPETFLYGEEDILYYFVQKNMVLCQDLVQVKMRNFSPF